MRCIAIRNAHCRRYWRTALETAQDQVGPVLPLIHRLYRVEAEAREFDAAQRFAMRQERSRPLLAELRAYLDDVS